MAGQGGRITCPRCGANNFDTVTACWKCGTALGAGGQASYANPVSIGGNERSYAPQAGYAAYATGDPGVAKRAALLLAITVPWIGLPIGWAFMMIEDTRRQAIGRFCATWSTIALIVHLFLMFLSMQALGAAMMKILPSLMNNQSSSRIPGGTGGLENGSGMP